MLRRLDVCGYNTFGRRTISCSGFRRRTEAIPHTVIVGSLRSDGDRAMSVYGVPRTAD